LMCCIVLILHQVSLHLKFCEVYVICFDQTEQVQRELKQGGIDAVIEQEAEKIGRECVDFLLRMAACDDIQDMSQEERAVPCRIIMRE